MSSIRTTTCDRCHVQVTRGEVSGPLQGLPVGPWWHLQFSSDFGSPGRRFVSWDLCPDCAELLQGLLRSEAGIPGYESDAPNHLAG